MPALNIMATHEAFLNSGCSPSWPSRIFPKRETPMKMAKHQEAERAEHEQPAELSITQLSTESAVLASPSVSSTPQRTNAATTPAAG